MAYDDICTCSHIKREHDYVGICQHVEQEKVTLAGGYSQMRDIPNGKCNCIKFVNRFEVPVDLADESLADFMTNLSAQIAEMKMLMLPLKAEADNVSAKLEEIDRQRREAIKAKADIEEKMKSFTKVLEKAQQAADLADSKAKQQQAIKDAEAEFLRLADSFDEITAGAPWREWAFSYQIEDAKRMALGKRVIVGNTMGTGKTLTSLITCDMLEANRVLIFTPATVMRSFVNEVKHWAPHRNVFLLGGMSRTERRTAVTMMDMAKQANHNFTVILNYEAMRKDGAFIEELKRLEFDLVILDEAHLLKDKKSLTFRQIKEVVNGDGHQPPCVFPMTGSPILNKPQDLWPLLNIIAPYDFSDEYYFLQDYCVRDWDTGKWKFSSTGLNGMQRRLRDKFIRRTKEQTGMALPEKTISVHEIELAAETHSQQYQAYKNLREQAAIWLDDDKAMSITTAIALITRERQMMTYPAGIKWTDNDQNSPTYGDVIFKCDVTQSVKLDYIIHPNGDVENPTWAEPGGLSSEIIEEKQVIMSQFKTPLQELKRRFDAAVAAGNPEYAAEIIDGDTPMERRQEFIDDFQNPNGRIRILLGNFKALGVGVTLTAASQMIVLDEEWNPGKNEQAYDRIHRIGQSKAVTIHILRVNNSIDEWMADLIAQKADLVEGFNNTVDIAQEYRRRLLGGE